MPLFPRPFEGRKLRSAPLQLAQWRALLQRPDTWLRLFCSLVVVWAASQLILLGFGRDQSIYAVVGQGIVNGQMPYRDLWDFKPPGIFLVYAAADVLFGARMWGPRLLEAFGMLTTAWLLVRASRLFFSDARPGFIAAALASWVHIQFDFWHTGQPENFGGFFTIAGLSLIARERSDSPRQELWSWLGCGLCFGIAFLMKPPLGGGALICAAYLMKREAELAGERGEAGAALGWVALRPLLAIGVASLLPIALIALWFWVAGALSDLHWTLFVFTPEYTKLGWDNRSAVGAFYLALENSFARHSALLAVGLVSAAFGGPLSTRDREGLGLFIGVIAMQLAGIALQAKFFEYHYGATIPLLAFIAGVGWFKIWRMATQGERLNGGAGAIAFASLVAVVAMARVPVRDVPLGFWARARERTKMWIGASEIKDQATADRVFHRAADFDLAADRDVAERLRALTTPDEHIFVWGFEPAIYWLADRPSASRYIYNVPQRVSWERDSARARLMQDLARNTPRFIVVQHHDVFKFVTGNTLDSNAALPEFEALASLVNQQYSLQERIEDFDLYRRNEVSR